MAAIKIPIVADVARAVSGVKDLGGEFDKVVGSLDHLADEAKDAEKALDWGTPDSLERVDDGVKDATDGMGDLERAADDTGDKLERKFKDAADAVAKVKKETKDLDDEKVDIDVDIDKDKKAREQLDTLKSDVAASGNESGQEWAGALSGGFESGNVVEGIVEVLAEATSGLSGPMQAAGIGVAAALALAYAELQKIADKTNEAKEAGGEWSQSFNTANVEDRLAALRDKFAEFSTTIADKSEWYEFGEAAETALEQIIDGADEGGVAVKDFMAAFNEDDPTRRLELLQTALQNTNDRTKELQERAQGEGLFKSFETANQVRELKEAGSALEALTEEQRIAIETEKAQADAMGVTVDQFRAYNELTDEAKGRVDALSEGQKAGGKSVV